jgi:hypothetical protein
MPTPNDDPRTAAALLDELEQRMRAYHEAQLEAARRELEQLRLELFGTQQALQTARDELQAQTARALLADPRSLSAIQKRLGQAFTYEYNPGQDPDWKRA